jgi:hypothetical protein
MAIPPNARAHVPQRSGIGLVAVPSSDPTCDVELWRKPATGSTSEYQLLAHLSADQIGGQQYTYVDPLPVDNRAWDYVGRHVALDRGPSTFSASFRRKAVSLPTIQPPVPQLSGQGMPADVFISTGRKIKLGTKQVPRSMGTTMYFPFSGFNPLTSTHSLFYALGEVAPGLTGVEVVGLMGCPLPVGVTITKVAMHRHRNIPAPSTNDYVEVIFFRGRGSTAPAALATLNSTASNYVTVNSSVMAEVTGTHPYYCQLRMRNQAYSVTQKSALAWVKVTYTRPSYDVTY